LFVTKKKRFTLQNYILHQPFAKCFLLKKFFSANFPAKIFQIEKAYRCFLNFSLREFLFLVKRILKNR